MSTVTPLLNDARARLRMAQALVGRPASRDLLREIQHAIDMVARAENSDVPMRPQLLRFDDILPGPATGECRHIHD